jgi:hypothetical protein
MYEAAMAHAWHEHGVRRVRGSEHSTAAEGVHQKIARKHKIKYRGSPHLDIVDDEEKERYADEAGITVPYDTAGPIFDNIGTYDAWEAMKPESYDNRYDAYDYALKSEASLEKNIGYVTFPKMGISSPSSKVMTYENTPKNRELIGRKHSLMTGRKLQGLEDAPIEGLGMVSTGGDTEHGFAMEGRKASLTPIVDHEAQHTIFGDLARKFGPNARHQIALKVVDAMDDDAYNACYGLAQKNGYTENHPEEIIGHCINYLTDPKARADTQGFAGISPSEELNLRSHVKRGWRQMQQFAANYVHNGPTLARSEDFFEENIRSAPKPLVIPDRYKDMQMPIEIVLDPNLLETEDVAKAQMGFNANIYETFAAAKMVSGGGDIPLSKMVKAYRAAEDDIEKAALEAYGIQHTAENLTALHTSLYGLSKALDVASMIQSYQIEPATQDATAMAEAIQRGAQRGYINPVKLNGKHSKGAMVVKDPVERKMYLLKPGAGKNSPALGVSEDLSSQSEREAAFWHVADAVGLGEFYPKADLVLVNGHQTAAMELLPLNYRNLGDKKKEDPNIASRILTPYLKDGTLHQWAFMDFLLGNPDRHSQNIMVDPDGRLVKLIDHGSAMAGNSFDPVNDPDSFIPYYLRAWTNRKFTTMSPKERMLALPSMDPQTAKGYDIWIKDLPDHQIAAILEEYHVNPQPALRRLAQIRATPGPKWQVVNKLWSGAT